MKVPWHHEGLVLSYSLEKNVELRMLELHHAPELLELIANHRPHFAEWLAWGRTTQTEDDARALIQNWLNRIPGGTPPAVGLWKDGKMVGGLLYFPVEFFARSAEIGYWLSPEAVGGGLMTRAVKAALEHLFDALELNRVVVRCAVENHKSRAVAERLGFTLEGVLKQSWPRASGEGFEDHAVYALLQSEWLEQKSRELN